MQPCPNCGEENPERARFCWSCGAALAQAVATAGEERKVVSVLFVDLVGFTAASEHADPEDVRARLRPYHARVKQEIERFGGTVEKFVGDAVMAVFGAPVAHEDDAERAVNAALRILGAMDELNEVHAGLELAVRAAVNTGEALVTLGARPAEGEGIVAGDVVNTAARLQQSAPAGGIVVGDTTHRLTRDLFEYERLEAVRVKGKAEPVPIWLARATRRRFGVDVEPIVRTPLIGRDDDLALLQSTYARTLRENSTQLVTITGEPGVGKTRLTAEFRRWVDDRPEIVFWRQGRSLPYGEGITYWALGEMVKAQAGILESDTPEDAAAKLDVTVQEVSGDPTEREWLSSRLAPLVGLSADVAGDREESFTAWRRFFEGLAAQRPLILVFEDLHWADDALLAFVEHLVDWTSGVPLLVLGTARPELYERRADWGGGKRNSNTVALSPLAAEETARLLAALLQRAVLPVETQQALLERAGGNPLYAEEFVRMLTDQGVLAPGGELRGESIAVPETVQALIAARLDTLPVERKALLHDAAVIGKVFWAGAVAAMGGRDEAAVRDGLHELARKELVRPARASSVKDQPEYSFWHLLVRDVAYAQIPRAERARKHVRAAEWIEDMAGERVTDHAELLVYHYEQALELAQRTNGADATSPLAESARRFLVLAGDRAMSLDLRKAALYYKRALELLDAPGIERGNVLLKLAEAQGTAEFTDHVRAVEEAVALFREHGDETREGAALVQLAHVSFLQGDSARTADLLDQAIELLERHPPGEELAGAYTKKAGTLAVGSRPDECLAATERALQVVNELGLKRFGARLLQYRGLSRCELGDFAGLEDVRAGLELGLELGDLQTAGIGYSNLGTITWDAVSPTAALSVYDEGIAFAERRGMLGNSQWLKAESTWPLYDLGRWGELLRRVADVEEWERVRGSAYPTLIALPQKALVLLHRGDARAAASIVDGVLPRAREAKDPQVLVPALAAAASVAAAQNDVSHAAALVSEFTDSAATGAAARSHFLADFVGIALEAGEQELARAITASAAVDSGRPAHSAVAARAALAAATGELEKALDLHQDAARRWREYGFVLGQARSLVGAAGCLLALGRPDEATHALSDARALFHELGAAPLLGEVDEMITRATTISA